MRVLSSPEALDQASKVAHRIFNIHKQPNQTFDNLAAMIDDNMFDPLHGFSQACRFPDGARH
jgi:hypothetical protein